MPIYLDGKEYADEGSLEAAYNPAIPESLKRIYITKEEGDGGTTPEMPLGSTEKLAGALKSEIGTSVAPDEFVRPEPSYMNPPEREVRPEAPKPEPIVLFKTKTGVEITDQDIETGMNVAMSAGPGTIAGVVSKTVDKGALAVAQLAEKEGLNYREVFDKTGFFKGADKRWRYEIDDSGMKWTPPKSGVSGPLHLFLDHPELYKAYPDLKNIRVHSDPYFKSKVAQWDGVTIKMGDQASLDKGLLMHEVQHAVQDIESFAKGGSPGKAGKDYELKYEKAVDSLRKEYLNLQKLDTDGSALNPKEQFRLDYLRHLFRKYSEYARAGDQEAGLNYLRLAGEVESRNVQRRVDLEPKDRAKYNPMDTEDFFRNEQIVLKEPVATSPYLKPAPALGPEGPR